jgi:hypothetical protein
MRRNEVNIFDEIKIDEKSVFEENFWNFYHFKRKKT